jgi:asparagine synthase (glutamine-hydrolysing)
MCGIAGWVDFGRDLTGERPTLDAMTDALASGGPDARGVWLDGHAGVGHTRNSVIDLAGGIQPMVAEEDGRPIAVLTYSGEVYNFRELRTELETRGHRFRCPHGVPGVSIRPRPEVETRPPSGSSRSTRP